MRALGASRTSVVAGGILAGNWARDPLWKNARAVPSLDLRFAENKSLTDAKTGASLVTFTRASSGTYVGSDGVLQSAITNEARFDHNPITGKSLGLLMEEERTNLILRSEEFDNASWTNVSTTESGNVAVAPNGTSTADKLIENLGAGFKSIDQTVAISALTYTFSVYVKAVERSIVQLLWSGGASTNFANFNLATGTVTAGTYTSATITPAGSDWFRLSITSALAAGNYSGIVSLQTNASATRAASYTGDGTSGLFLWGAQLEAGAFATSYIPTTTATVTRAADVASITGTNFSSWYNQTEGTVFGQFLRTALTNSQQGRVFSFSDGSNTNAIEIYQTGVSNPSAQIIATTTQALWTPSGFTVGTSIKEVLGYQLNNSNASFNGSAETLDTACNIPTVTQARIGDRQDGVRNLNGTIQRLTYWPVRLPNPTLQAITQP